MWQLENVRAPPLGQLSEAELCAIYYLKEMFSHWADCARQCVMKTVDLKLWIALVKWVTCFGPLSATSLAPPWVWIIAWLYKALVDNGNFLFYKVLSSNWSLLCPLASCVWTYFLTYLNFPSLVQLLWHPLLRWRGSCPFAELYCNHFSSVNIIFTGLIVHRACNFNTVLWTSLGFSTRGDLKRSQEWSVLSVTLLLPRTLSLCVLFQPPV